MRPDRILLAANGSWLNRGCAAIEIGTTTALRSAGFRGDCVVAPFDHHINEHSSSSDPMVSRRLDVLRPDRRFGSAWLKRRFRHPFGSSEPHRERLCSIVRVLDSISQDCRAVLWLGGDNYTLDYGRPEVFFALNRHVRAAGLPVVIWGASVAVDGDSDYVESCARRLRDVDLILARGSDGRVWPRSEFARTSDACRIPRSSCLLCDHLRRL